MKATFPNIRSSPRRNSWRSAGIWPFFVPGLAYLTLTQVAPALYALYLSFTHYDPAQRGAPDWIGLQNYLQLLSDPAFRRALLITAQFAAEVLPLNIILAVGLALLLNAASRRLSALRTAFILPSVVSAVAVSLLWLWLYQPTFGLLNQALAAIGQSPLPWLSDPAWALHSLVIMRVWRGVGWNAVIYLAALQTIPQEVKEAARVDGAGRWQSFRHVTWPLLTPVTVYVIVTGLISTFQTFAEPYVMTKGGPLEATTTVGLLIYKQAFEYGELGLASASSFVLLIVIFSLALLNYLRVRRQM